MEELLEEGGRCSIEKRSGKEIVTKAGIGMKETSSEAVYFKE